MARQGIVLVVLVLFGLSLQAAEDTQSPRALVGHAWTAWQQGQREEAVDLYRQAAEQGHPVAQYQLGLIHELGLGVPADADEAEYWYGQAVGQGYCPGEIPDPAEYAAD